MAFPILFGYILISNWILKGADLGVWVDGEWRILFFLLSWFYMVRNSHETPYKTHVLLGISPLIVGYIIIPILLSVYPILINGNSRILKWRNCTIQAYIYMYLTCGKCLQFSLLTLTNMEKYTMILNNSSQDWGKKQQYGGFWMYFVAVTWGIPDWYCT